MSEYETFVACDCYERGLGSNPPIPRSRIGRDVHGNLMDLANPDPDENESDEWWDWWEHGCSHDYGRLVEEIWLGTDWNRYPDVVEALSGGSYPLLRSMLESSGGVICPASAAKDTLAELERFLADHPRFPFPGIVDEAGKPLVVSLRYMNDVWEYPEIGGESSARHAMEVLGECGIDAVLLSSDGRSLRVQDTEGRTLLSAPALMQQVGGQCLDSSDSRYRTLESRYPWEVPPLVWTSYTDPETGKSVQGISVPAAESGVMAEGKRWDERRKPGFIRAAVCRLPLDGYSYLFFDLRRFLEAAVKTNHPVVTYHNGGGDGIVGEPMPGYEPMPD